MFSKVYHFSGGKSTVNDTNIPIFFTPCNEQNISLPSLFSFFFFRFKLVQLFCNCRMFPLKTKKNPL